MQVRTFREFIRQSRALVQKAHKITRRYLAARSEHPMILETNGTEFVVWHEHQLRKANRIMRSAVEPLNASSLMRAMRSSEYRGEPITVIIHPPCVCVKTLQPHTENLEKWLASHLIDVAPPGNRRKLVMCYRTLPLNHLVVAFARRAFLSDLIETAQQSRISLKGIYAGSSLAADSFVQQFDQRREQNVEFSLCRYQIFRNGDGIQIFPRPTTSHIDNSSSSSETPSLPSRPSMSPNQMSTMSSQSILLTTKRDTIDFSPQIGLPKALSSLFMRRLAHVEFILILVLLGIVFMHWGIQAAGGNLMSDTDYLRAVGELTKLRQENTQAVKDVELAAGLQEPRHKTCNFLKSVALATPPQTWLSSITFGTSTSGSASVFTLHGFSLSGNEPLLFADSLRSARDVRSVTLTKANIVEYPVLELDSKKSPGQLTKFEISGEYERE